MKLLKKIRKKIRNRKTWTLYLYFNGIRIKKLKIRETEEPTKNWYIINVWYKKQIFNSNKVNIIVRPKYLMFSNEKKKKTYWGVVLENGIEI